MNTAAPPWRVTAGPPSYNNSNMPGPAYTAVAARRDLGQHPAHHNAPNAMSTPAQAPADAAANRKKVDWPPSVRVYVQRSFAADSQIPGIERQDMEKKLKEIITAAADSDSLHSIDWEKLPLPQQLIHQEREAAKAFAAHNAWQNVSGPLAPRPADTNNKSTKKKRKSDEMPDSSDNGIQPPWRKTNKQNPFEDRISYAPGDKRQRIEADNGKSKHNKAELEKRKRRFGDSLLNSTSPSRDVTPPEVDSGPVVGTCEKLEKNYFRLTAPPKPEMVRPQRVLEKTLDLLKKKWRDENNYVYICDQFKSLRQDLTVQHIKNEFTVNVYEIHARIALEKGDLGEYNQCQTQLRALYKQKLGGHPAEFLAYRILYFIHTCNRTDMNDLLAELKPADKKDLAVKHALDVRSAIAMGNYHRFFQLYLDSPNMGAYMMDKFVERERLAALAKMTKAYKPSIKIRLITEELGFESDEETVRLLIQHVNTTMLAEKDDGVYLTANSSVGQVFEDARSGAFRVVDIKGQL